MDERRWEFALGVIEQPQFQELARTVLHIQANLSGDLKTWDVFGRTRPMDETKEVVDLAWTRYINGDHYQSLDATDRQRVQRAYAAMNETHQWAYGMKKDEESLLGDETAVYRQPAYQSDSFILTGVVGADFLRVANKKAKNDLETQLQIVEGRLAQLRVLGVLAVMAAGDILQTEPSAAYASPEVDGIVNITSIKGTFHGDFSTARQPRTTFIKDPFGEASLFGPRLEPQKAFAYHSTEPSILAALLRYQVQVTGVTPQALHAQITQRLEEASRHTKGGAFGDFGQENGKSETRLLKQALRSEKPANGDILTSQVIFPAEDNRFQMYVTEQGIGVRMTPNEKFAYLRKDWQVERFEIPKEEVNDYIVTLMSAGGGRTSYTALKNVLDGLLDPTLQ
jgi:hypothetical protein